VKSLKPLALLCAAGLTTAVLGHATPAQALIFAFEFDETPDTTVTPPIVGTGTFSFDGNPGPGTFALTSLPNFNFLFNFGSESFSNADITTPLANILVGITVVGSDYSVNFGGSRGGPLGGSIDFDNSNKFLNFQPDFGSLYFTAPSPQFTALEQTFGTFQGLTPVPGPLPLFGAGAAFGFSRKLRRKIRSSQPELISTTTD
jgi:hypothetical protein